MRAAAERRLAAIMFTDIVGSTAATAQSETGGLELRDRHRSLVRTQVERYRGRFIEAPGDESLTTFESAVDAVHAALAIQKKLEEDVELQVRITIHTGETIFRGEEVFGDAVNIAARLRPLARPGEILISGEVARSIRNQPHLETSQRGEHKFKGVEESVVVHAVSGTPPTAAAVGGELSRSQDEPALSPVGVRRFSRWLISGAGLAVAAAIGIWLVTPSVEVTRRSIMVLPFDNLSPNPENAFFAVGVQDELLSRLSEIPDVRVVSRTTADRLAATGQTIPEIATTAGVAHVLEGSVRRDGDEVRVTVQLIEAASDDHLWAESYQRQLTDVFEIESAIASDIATQLGLRLDADLLTRFAEARTSNLEAYDLFLKAQQSWQRGGLEDAIAYLERAVELDPDYADAWGELGIVLAYYASSFHEWPRTRDTALTAINRSLAIDPDSPSGNLAMAFVFSWCELECRVVQATPYYKKAMEQVPGDPIFRTWHGAQLTYLGQFDEAKQELERAIEMDPLAAHPRARLVLNAWASNSEDAGRLAEETVHLFPNDAFVRIARAAVYGRRRQVLESLVELRRALELEPRNVFFGRPFLVSLASLGEIDAALDWQDWVEGRMPGNRGWQLNRATLLVIADRVDALESYVASWEPNRPNRLYFNGIVAMRRAQEALADGDADARKGYIATALNAFERLDASSPIRAGSGEMPSWLGGGNGALLRYAVTARLAGQEDLSNELMVRLKETWGTPPWGLLSLEGDIDGAIASLQPSLRLLRPGPSILFLLQRESETAFHSIASDRRFQALLAGFLEVKQATRERIRAEAPELLTPPGISLD